MSAQSPLAQTNTIVIPKEAEAKFGNTVKGPLFFNAGIDLQAYGASEFEPTGADVIRVTAMAFRVDDGATGPLDVVLKDAAGRAPHPVDNVGGEVTSL